MLLKYYLVVLPALLINKKPTQLPEQHLLEHPIGRDNPWEPSRGQGVELQVGGDQLSCHLSICSCSGTAASEEHDGQMRERRQKPLRFMQQVEIFSL